MANGPCGELVLGALSIGQKLGAEAQFYPGHCDASKQRREGRAKAFKAELKKSGTCPARRALHGSVAKVRTM